MTAASGLFGITWRDIPDATALDVDFENDSFKMALAASTYTPNFDTHDQYADLTNEIPNGSGYTTGGNVMTGETFTISSGTLVLDATDTAWTSSTFSSVRQRMMYDDTLTGDPLILNTDFGSDHSVTSGTLTVQESASGLATLDYTP